MNSTLNPVIHALRHVNDQLTRAGEAIIRSARVPRPRQPDRATAPGPANSDTAERLGRAA